MIEDRIGKEKADQLLRNAPAPVPARLALRAC
jgi:hypothetical protein